MPTSTPPDYINKYLQTCIINGQLQIANSTGTYVYFLAGGETLQNIVCSLPVLPGDDTFAFRNFNNEFQAPQTFDSVVSTMSGIQLMNNPDPNIDSDVSLDDGININTGYNTGTNIGTDPQQKLGFFGVPTTPQPQATSLTSTTANLTDLWNACISLGIINGAVSSGVAVAAGSNPAAPSNVGGRWGLFMPANDSSLARGVGLLSNLTTTSGTTGSTFINNRPAMTITTSASTHSNGGFHTSQQICTMTNNPTAMWKVTTSVNTNYSLYLGFASGSSLGSQFDTALNSSLHGAMIGFAPAATNYTVITNSGTGTQTTNTTGLPALQTAGTPAIFTLSYNSTVPSLTWTIQTSPTVSTTGTITTGLLPSATTTMYLFCGCATASSSSPANVITIEDVEIVLGNDSNVF